MSAADLPFPWAKAHPELVRLAAAQFTARQIADALSAQVGVPITRNAVLGYAHRRKVKIGDRMPCRGGGKGARVAVALKPVVNPVAQKPAPAPYTPPPHPRGFSGVRCEKVEPVALRDLRDHHCRWPIDGDSRAGTLRYCGLRKAPLSPNGGATSYCEEHGRLAYDPRPRRGISNPPMPRTM